MLYICNVNLRGVSKFLFFVDFKKKIKTIESHFSVTTKKIFKLIQFDSIYKCKLILNRFLKMKNCFICNKSEPFTSA